MQNFCFEHENSSFYRTQYSHMQSWIVSLSVCASAGVCVSVRISYGMCVHVCVWVLQTVSWCCFLSILASKQNKRKSTTAAANDEPQQLIIKLIWFNTRQQSLSVSSLSLRPLYIAPGRVREREREGAALDRDRKQCQMLISLPFFNCFRSTSTQTACLPAPLAHITADTAKETEWEWEKSKRERENREHPN